MRREVERLIRFWLPRYSSPMPQMQLFFCTGLQSNI